MLAHFSLLCLEKDTIAFNIYTWRCTKREKVIVFAG